MTTNKSVERGLVLLSELLAMKSKIDGVPRSAIGVIGPREGYDQFTQDVQDVATLIMAASMAVPMMERLAAAGRSFEQQGLIKVDHGESYANKALDHLLGTATTI